MAYVTVPKDLTHVKSKVVFGLTKRQLICFGGALLVGVPLYFLTRDYLSTSAAALLMVFIMLPGFLLAMYSATARRCSSWQSHKSIKFKLPIIEEDFEMSLDNDAHIKTVVQLTWQA